MKALYLFLMASLISLLFGCNDDGNGALGPIIPLVRIEYVDKEGNPILEESESIQLYENGERLDVLSVTDDKGIAIEFGYTFDSFLHTEIFDKVFFETSIPKMDRQYVIKYKVPRSLGESIEVGESVEEIRLTFRIDGYNGYSSKFTNAWYKGKELRIVPPELINPNCYNPQVEPDEEAIERTKKELLYSGDTVALMDGFYIHLILPTERVK
jgi:hypothetical protein